MTEELYKPVFEDPIASIFEDFSNHPEVSLQLFDSNEQNQTLKTDLNDPEVILSNNIFTENELIKKDIPGFDLYGVFLHQFKRHKVSRNRLSRMEFVDVNKKDKFDEHLNKFANLKNLTESRT